MLKLHSGHTLALPGAPMILMPCSRFKKQRTGCLNEIRHISPPLSFIFKFLSLLLVFPGMTKFVHSVLEGIQLILFALLPYFFRLHPYCPVASPCGLCQPSIRKYPEVTSTCQLKTLAMAKGKYPLLRLKKRGNPFLRTNDLPCLVPLLFQSVLILSTLLLKHGVQKMVLTDSFAGQE